MPNSPLRHEDLNLAAGLGIIIGVVQCFFGYRLFKFVLGLTGFLVGGVLGASIGYAMSGQEVVALLAGLVGGVLGAALMVGLCFVGVFVIGALLGAVVGATLFAGAGSNLEPVVLLILGVIGGVVALLSQKFMIIVSTAFVGAWNVVVGIAYFVTGMADPTSVEGLFRAGGTQPYVILLCWFALGIVGVIVQYRSTPAKTPFPPIRMKLDQDRERLNFWLCRNEQVRGLDQEQTLRQLITLLRASGFDVGFSEVWVDDLNPTSLSGATLVGPVDEVCGQGPPLVEP